MQREGEGELIERRRLRQSNLQLYSDLSLSVLSRKTSTNSRHSSFSGGAESRNSKVAAVSVEKEGVTTRPQTTRRSATSEDDRELHHQSHSTETNEQEDSRVGCEGRRRRRENGRKKHQRSRESLLEIQICSELIDVRNKMKREMEVLAEEEERISDMGRDLESREERLTQRLDQIEERVEEIKLKEMEMKQRVKQIAQNEQEIKGREEKLGKREEEVKKTEMEMTAKEEEMRMREEKLQQLQSSVTQTENDIKSKMDALRLEEECLGKRKELLRSREKELKEREIKQYSQVKWLSQREESVREMEELACEAHRTLMECIQREVEGRLVEVEGGWRGEVDRLEREMREKNKEVKRLRECYNSTKKTNETFKTELEKVEEKSCKLQSQLTATRSHLTALQKKEITIESQQQLEAQKQLLTDIEALKLQLTSCELVNDERKKDHVSSPTLTEMYEVLGLVMHWICRVHLSRSLTPSQLTSVQKTSSKILPILVPLLPSISHSHLPVLEFIHWCTLHTSTNKKMKFCLSSSLRRIGDIVSKPLLAELKGEKIEASFTSSSNLNIRTLSYLIIFQTLTQVDCLAHVFQHLHRNLDEHKKARELFLLYRGVDCILPYMKGSCKLLCSHTVHTYLLLSSETSLLSQFLGTRQWFQTCSGLLRDGCDTQTLEKLVTILQTLSQIRGMRGLFESERVSVAIQDLLREKKKYKNSSNLCVNLQSILTGFRDQTTKVSS